MPHSLRAKLKYLTICGHIRKKDYERLCNALDNEGVLDKIKEEIEEKVRPINIDGIGVKSSCLGIINEYKEKEE